VGTNLAQRKSREVLSFLIPTLKTQSLRSYNPITEKEKKFLK